MQKCFTKIPELTGIYHNTSSCSFMSTKRLKGKLYQKSFATLGGAELWRQNLKMKPNTGLGDMNTALPDSIST